MWPTWNIDREGEREFLFFFFSSFCGIHPPEANKSVDAADIKQTHKKGVFVILEQSHTPMTFSWLIHLLWTQAQPHDEWLGNGWQLVYLDEHISAPLSVLSLSLCTISLPPRSRVIDVPKFSSNSMGPPAHLLLQYHFPPPPHLLHPPLGELAAEFGLHSRQPSSLWLLNPTARFSYLRVDDDVSCYLKSAHSLSFYSNNVSFHCKVYISTLICTVARVGVFIEHFHLARTFTSLEMNHAANLWPTFYYLSSSTSLLSLSPFSFFSFSFKCATFLKSNPQGESKSELELKNSLLRKSEMSSLSLNWQTSLFAMIHWTWWNFSISDKDKQTR